MSTFVFINNFSTTLAAALTSTGTTVTLASSTGLPTLAAGQIMPLTLNDAATGQIYEILYVTAISGATLTVERAQEGTAAQAWAIGDYAKCMPTAQSVEPAGGNPAQTFQVAAATASNQAVNLSQLSAPARTISFTANGTWTVPTGITEILVSGAGGGGGGGGGGGTVGATGYGGAGGGQGGGAAQSVFNQIISVTSGHILTITIGAYGLFGSGGGSTGTGGSNGSAGGNTTLIDTTANSTLLTLLGGGGGYGGSGQTNASAGISSAGSGGAGGYGYPAGSDGSDGAFSGNGGVGASSLFGGGGASGRAAQGQGAFNGTNAYGYAFGAGGGGGGGAYGPTPQIGGPGGNGAPGYLIIRF